MTGKIRHIIQILFLCLLFPALSGAQPYTEYELKAAYLFNFAKFVTWPDNAFDKSDNQFIIGIYGKNPFGTILYETVKNKTLNNRNVKILICESAEEAKLCHILFMSQINGLQASELIRSLGGLPVLTVGDQIDDFCQQGGIINFTPQNYKNRFEINNISAQLVKLTISSKLLALAKIISEDEIKF